MSPRSFATYLAPLTLVFAVACGNKPVDPIVPDPGVPVDPKLPPDRQAELERIRTELEATKALTLEQFMDRYDRHLTIGIQYQPSGAANLDRIQASSLALNNNELSTLNGNGFVISGRQSFPSFLYGYEALYANDLPLYVSADSVLHALHASYDKILESVEIASLVPQLSEMLEGMRANLAQGQASLLGAQAERDVDLYLAVALSLLVDRQAPPVKGADAAEIKSFYDKAKAASGAENVTFFGVARDFDFSQFKPRGHYTDSETLKQYFRAMMWLGRIELRIIETQPDLSSVFHRRQLESAYAIQAVMNLAERDHWQSIDGAIQAFVGESDNMTVKQLDLLLADVGAGNAAALSSVSDEKITDAMALGGYGSQRISSQIMINGIGEGTMPLSSVFLLLGQRYVVDSHVFSNVVYDRVQRGAVMRMMPDPLDVAFAALHNDQAGVLLADQIRDYHYAPDLHAMRFLVDAHGADFWGSNLYNRWLSSLRQLSPSDELANPAAHGLPALVASEAWGRRMLNAQLASWAELRHDTILYAKQSYTGGTSCEFPDAYVDPYPAFWASLIEYAQHARQVVLSLGIPPSQASAMVAYFDRFELAVTQLRDMAQSQREGTPFTVAQMAFINQAVVFQQGCGSPTGADGWFADMYYDASSGLEFDPTIADVHTQPTDEVGNPVGRVLHVGTGGPRLMVVTLETCDGAHAYAGLASSYYEKVTENFQRLDDEAWADELYQTPPSDVVWTQDLIAR